jgi:starch-binding outer membrane protein, SusD/RagB family
MLRRAGIIAAIALGMVGCDGLLKVTNPGSLQEGQLDDPALETFLINGAVGEFQFAYTNYAFLSGVLADEGFLDHPNVDLREFALHDFNDINGANEAVYGSLQQARQSADDATTRVKKMLGAKAGASLNVARALIYGGYTYVLLGEGFCESPVNLSGPLPSRELLTRAVAHFDEGIAVATAALTDATGTTATDAQDLISLAQVGAARASLKKGDLAKARAYALAVPDDYERLAYYSANSARENNAIPIAVRQAQPWLGMQSRFRGLNDARVPQPPAPRVSLAGNSILPPLKPSMYGGWTGKLPGQSVDVASSVRFASSLEARYILTEVDGPGAAMLTFVNGRRAFAGKPPVNLDGPALVAEFRMQRAFDFYLTGQRLGDLRRYADAGTDLFPTGKYPTLRDSYGTMHCFIVPLSEKSSNPNY